MKKLIYVFIFILVTVTLSGCSSKKVAPGSVTEKQRFERYKKAMHLQEVRAQKYKVQLAKEKELEEKKALQRKINVIRRKLQMIPSAQYERNLDLYQQLLELDPENSIYKAKVEYYIKKVKASK